MGYRTSRVKPLPHQSRVGRDVDSAENRRSAPRPGPLISYAQLQRELHRQATQRKPRSCFSPTPSPSTTASSSPPPPSQYSISKLEAFDNFHNRTSLVHAIAILLATPMPCLVLMLVLESIPLVHPSLGWEANYMYFARSFFAMLAVAVSLAIECQEFIPDTQLTWRHLGLVAFCQACTFVGTLIGISAAAGIFPVPYSLLIAIGPTVGVGCSVHYLLVRPRIPSIPEFASQHRHLLVILAVEALPLLVYPAYATVFMQLSSRHQVWFSLLLPVVKYALRSLLLRRMLTQMDVVGTMSASSHLFHVLFTATCLQNAKTYATVGFILAWNVTNAVKNCLKMVYYARKNLKLQRATPYARDVLVPLQAAKPQESTTGLKKTENVAKRALALAEHPTVLSRLFRHDLSVLVSSYHRYSSPKWIMKHQDLLLKQQRQQKNPAIPRAGRFAFQRTASSERLRKISIAIRHFLKKSPAEVLLNAHLDAVPSGSSVVMPTGSNSPVVSEMLNVEEVQDTLAILHANEICLLHSYVSGMVYLVYGVYVRVVFLLPNRAFITAMMHVTSEQEVQSTTRIIYTLYSVELLIMIAYCVVIRWTLCVPSIRQLAFILYSQRWIVQPKLIMVTVIIFAFPLMHTGDDLTFDFMWLKAKPSTDGTSEYDH